MLPAIGMQEGGICLWDLTESEDQHSVQQSGQGSATLRRPSFTTEAAAEGATAGAITGLQWLPATGMAGRACLQPHDPTLRPRNCLLAHSDAPAPAGMAARLLGM